MARYYQAHTVVDNIASFFEKLKFHVIDRSGTSDITYCTLTVELDQIKYMKRLFTDTLSEI